MRGDPQQPGGEGDAPVLIAVDRAQGTLEGLRGQIFGILLVAAVRIAERIHAAHVDVVQLPEGGPIVARPRDEVRPRFLPHHPSACPTSLASPAHLS